MKSHNWFLLSTAVAVLFILAMPGTSTLWTDEAQTYRYAQQPDFRAWRTEFVTDGASEGLMPTGMLVPWLAARVIGTSEWSMRAPNMLWSLLALLAMILISRQLKLPWLPILFAVQPFLWFYTNEARPYALQIAEGAWLLLSLFKWADTADSPYKARWVWCFLVVGVLLCSTSLLGIIPFVAMLATGAAVTWKTGHRPPSSSWIPLTLTFPIFLLLGAYYVWALHRGAVSAKVWTVTLGNVAFSFYELLGFTGLGPGRVALRGAATANSGSGAYGLYPYVPAITALFVVYCLLASAFFRAWKTPEQKPYLLITSATLILSLLALGILATFAHFPFWGRHLAPAFPALVVLTAIALASASSRVLPSPALSIIFCALLLISSCQLRYFKRHARDNYREASKRAALALAKGKRVWWFADFWGAKYYGLNPTITDPWASNMAITLDQYPGDLHTLPPPDLIVLSKPSVYDRTESLRTLMRQRGYHQTGEVQAFTFFEK